MSVSGAPSEAPVGEAGRGAAGAESGESQARWRRLAWLVLLAPVLVVVVADFATRGGRLVELPPRYVASYAAAVIESALLWGSLLWAASIRKGGFRWIATALFVVLFTLSVGVQLYFHNQYATYLNLDATLFGTSVTESIFGQLSADGGHFAQAMLPPFVFSILVALLARRLVRPTPRSAMAARLVAPALVVAVFLVPCSYRRVQASTPDVIYFHAIGGLVKELSGERTEHYARPGLRKPPVLPRLAAKPTTPRNVVLVLTESVRFDGHCSEPTLDCPVAPTSNRAMRARHPLLQLRSNSSTTAIQLAVLWTGLQPTESREALHAAPTIFDYAHAAGLESAYWTSHHMMFANSRLWVQDLPTRFQCGATDLEPDADIDMGGDDALLVDRALAEMAELREPFLAVVHVGNTHLPYKVDPEHAPFQPSSPSKAPQDNELYRNHYKNAIHLQDRSLGRLLEAIERAPYGARTVTIFTSDHGEAFREHEQLAHTGSIYDEEIHVPGWVHAPEGTLSDEERRNLEARRTRASFHTDMTPTVLDLLGLHDEPAIVSMKSAMPGESWLRPGAEPKPLALTNCSGVWGCAFQSWGMMRGTLKLEAREWDSAWHCFDLARDPLEKNDLGPEACGELVELAERVHGGRPGARPVSR